MKRSIFLVLAGCLILSTGQASDLTGQYTLSDLVQRFNSLNAKMLETDLLGYWRPVALVDSDGVYTSSDFEAVVPPMTFGLVSEVLSGEPHLAVSSQYYEFTTFLIFGFYVRHSGQYVEVHRADDFGVAFKKVIYYSEVGIPGTKMLPGKHPTEHANIYNGTIHESETFAFDFQCRFFSGKKNRLLCLGSQAGVVSNATVFVR